MMGCTKCNNRMSYGRLLMAPGEHSPEPKILRTGEANEIDDGDGAKVMEEEPVGIAAVQVEIKLDAG